MFEMLAPILEDLSIAVGLDPKELWKKEGFDTIKLDVFELPTELALKFSLEQSESLLKNLNASFLCHFGLHYSDLNRSNEDPIVLNVRSGITQTQIDEFHVRIDDVETVEFTFCFYKKQFLQNQGISSDHCNYFLYVYSAALTSFLAGISPSGKASSIRDCLTVFEEKLWQIVDVEGKFDFQKEWHKAVVLVLNHDIYLNGEFLAFIGGTHLHKWKSSAPERRADIAALKKIYADCRASVVWDERWLKGLTPPLFVIKEGTWKDKDAIVSTIQVHLFNLVVLYTANRVSSHNSHWIATYSSHEAERTMALYSPAQKNITADDTVMADTFYEFFTWAYSTQFPQDRMAFVRTVITEKLMRILDGDTYKEFLVNSKSLKADLEKHWAQFIHTKLDRYWEEEQELEESVTKTMDSYSQQLASMTKSVSDSMLAAVAALLGSIVAAGFGSDQFNPFIFSTGMGLYSLYVLFFPFIYNMHNQLSQYRILSDSMKKRIERFKEKMTEEGVKRIAGDIIAQSEKNFCTWFYVSVAIYIFVVLAGIMVAIYGPTIFLMAG